jgi:predicted ester cyclase
VVVRWTARGTHKGELMGIPATGKPVVVTGMDIFHISSGKVVESWTNWDALGMMQQLGVIPPMG